jgi:hypothetical protein
MWEGLRNDEDEVAVELWEPMLQLFPNLEGVEKSEYLKYCTDSEGEYSDSDSGCPGSSWRTDSGSSCGSDSDCEGRFNSWMDGGEDQNEMRKDQRWGRR